MKKIILAVATFFVVSGSIFAADAPVFRTRMDSLAYAFGITIGKNLLHDSIYVDFDILKQGIADGFNQRSLAISEDKIREVMQTFQQERQERMQQLMKEKEAEKQKLGAKNLELGKKFLDSNAKAPGVKVTSSGLQYRIIKQGTGASPKPEDKVKVNYEGKLISGKIFDSSFERGQPIEFPLNGVIKGWTEGLQLMKEGGEAIFYIPSELGYGERGAGDAIGANEVLIFKVDLLKVEPARDAAKPDSGAQPAHK